MQIMRGVAIGRHAMRHTQRADAKYPVHNLPENVAAYWRSVRADDAAEYRAEIAAAAAWC